MKLNLVLPWLCVLGVSVGLASVYVKGTAKDAELAKLRDEAQQSAQLRSELDGIKDQTRVQQEEINGLRKDKEELLRLRNEIGKLREERQQLSKQVVAAQSEIQRAQAQTAEARAGAQQAQNENQQLRTTVTQSQQASAVNTCINALRQLDAAKQQWALENNKSPQSVPTPKDIAPYLPNQTMPTCPAGGTYTLNAVSQKPVCTIPGHVLP